MAYLRICAPRAGWIGMAVVAAALAVAGGCGSVVESPGSGGAKTTGSGSSGGTSGTISASSSGATTSSSGATTSSTSSGGIECTPACGYELTCCDGHCVELDNDLLNCGACGHACGAGDAYCHESTCQPIPCTGAPPCPSADFCCGAECCSPGALCCDNNGGPVQPNPHCAMPANGTCPQSCFVCN
jgi:hypothetical protein